MGNSTNSTVIKKKNFIKVLKEKAGNISYTCDSIGINRTTYYNWLEKDEKFKREVEAVNESLIDFVESCLMKNIKNGDTTATIFFLKTKGKKRGYVEKQEIEHSGEVKQTITFEEAVDIVDEALKEELEDG